MDAKQDFYFMRQALAIARNGEGVVEPNPMVGCVLVRDNNVIGEGFHQKFGGPHAEVNAIASCDNPKGCTAYVTLEPCCHHGKTGPCSDALMEAGVSRVVIGIADPFYEVAGKGIEQLRAAGIEVVVGVEESDAKQLIRPYLKRIEKGMPWVIAKWAMTLDGKIATRTGASKWISCAASRAEVHKLRGRVDAVIAGIGTVKADDPMLNARPSGPRNALRVIVDPNAETPLDSRLVKTADEFPVVVAVSNKADSGRIDDLRKTGCQVIQTSGEDHVDQLTELLKVLGERDCTNVLVEGGGGIFGALNDGRLIDEVHVFIGPKIFGGTDSKSVMGGTGIAILEDGRSLQVMESRQIEKDMYIVARFD